MVLQYPCVLREWLFCDTQPVVTLNGETAVPQRVLWHYKVRMQQ